MLELKKKTLLEKEDSLWEKQHSNKKEKKGIEDLCDNPARLINGHDIIKGNPQKEKKDQKPISPCFEWECQNKKWK